MSDDSTVDAFDGEVLDLVIPASLDTIRIDRVLSMLTGLSRSETSDILTSGAVTLNEKVVVKSSTSVEEGQRLVAVLPAPESTVVQADATVVVDVVYDDPDFAVVNKVPGQVVHPGAGQRHGTLVAGLLALYPQMQELSAEGICDPLRPGIVHRLDKGTSGVLVVAKTPEGFLNLSTQLAERLMERTYYGMVEGHVAEERGVVDAPIGRSTRTPTLMAVGGARPHALRGDRAHRQAPSHDTAPPATRHWSHPPDPRAPGHDRPSGRERPALRAPAREAPRGGPVLPPLNDAGVRPPAHR
jgi:RluA family pseudouridine synthase